MRCVSPAYDNSTCKRPFHSILHAECSAYVSQRQNKPRDSQIAFIRRFWRKLSVISFQFKIYRRLNANFTPFYIQNVLNTFSSAESNPETLKSLIMRWFSRKLPVISLPFKIFRRLNANFTPFCMRNVVHVFPNVKTNPETRKSLWFVNFDENYALSLSCLRYFNVWTPFSLHFACRT